jgi:hypothetical protein
MTRTMLIVGPAAALGLFLVVVLCVTAEEKSPKAKPGHAIDTFLKSLEPAGGKVSPDSEFCPGDVDQCCGDEPTDGEEPGDETTADEPGTLPEKINAGPVPTAGGKIGDKAPVVSSKALSPQLRELKEKLRDTLAWYYDHPQRVNERSPWGIMHWLIPFGVDSYVLDGQGKRQNTVGYLCFNYPCKGQRLFHLNKRGQLDAYIGPGLQGHKGQFLAMLAQSRIDSQYPMRVENRDFKVTDLIEYEKYTCEAGTELTFKLIALTHYLKHDEKWTNFKGEEWDLPRLIREELKQPVVGAACGGTHRMTGFSYAVRKHQARGLLMDGQWQRASKFIDDYHDYTFTLQNRDGSFSTNWFASKGDAPDAKRRVQTTGHILEWMVYSLPAEDLKQKEVVSAVEYLTQTLSDGRESRWEIGPLGHALHALALYDERVFEGKPGNRAVELAGRGSKVQ